MDYLKEKLRKDKLNLRKNLTLEEKEVFSEKIIERLKKSNIFQEAKSIMLYCSHQNEVDLNELIKHSLKKNKEVILPTINKKLEALESYQLNCLSEFITGPYSIIEPNKKNKEPYLDKIDLILIPGIVFDKRGNRIGYGHGFYDKFLLEMTDSIKIGIAYDFQIIKQIKENHHDVSMDFIISEKEVIDCKSQKIKIDYV